MEPRYHLWVGSETGALKGIDLSSRRVSNFTPGGSWSRDCGATAMSWGGPGGSQVLLGCRDGCVRLFDPPAQRVTRCRRCPGGRGPFCGVATYGSAIVTCVESGLIKVWREDEEENAELELQAGPGLCCLRQDPARPQRVATGGRDNALKIWDLQRPREPLFAAKNVRNDWLELRVPVWERDVAFLPAGGGVLTCTAHRQVRLYDPSSPQRRPVLETQFGEGALTCLAPRGHASVLVGSARGELALIDLRKGRVVRALGGCGGSVRAVLAHPALPLAASCCLDRFLRVHDLSSGGLRHKVYLKSQPTGLLMNTDLNWEAEEPLKGEEEEKEEEEVGEGQDALWDAMETVTTPRPRPKKRKLPE